MEEHHIPQAVQIRNAHVHNLKNIDEVLYVPAALALHQRPGVPGIRSTFGTGTELLNSLRLMYSRLASHRCPNGHYLAPSLRVAAGKELLCPECGAQFLAPSAEELAFNSQGACPQCGGIGTVRTVDSATLVPDDSLTIDEGAVAPWNSLMWSLMTDICREMGVRTNVPFRDLTAQEKEIVFHGPAEKKHIFYHNKNSNQAGELDFTYFNATYTVENALAKVKDEKGMKRVEKFLKEDICPACHGTRLSAAARAPKLRGLSLDEACRMPLSELVGWVQGVPDSLPAEMRPMAENIVESFIGPAKRLMDLGLGYLTLDRAASTLSTGERQRMQLARAVRNRTTGVLYVLDEPSIGLHPSNIVGLTGVMHDLIADGNSVILVDHDTQILKEADWIVEMGPEAGAKGGHVIAQGTIPAIEADPASQIGPFLSGKADTLRRKRALADALFAQGTLHLSTAQLHTVKPLEVDLPKGRLTVVTGVSGSGKTTLVLESLVPALEARIDGKRLQGRRFFLQHRVPALSRLRRHRRGEPGRAVPAGCEHPLPGLPWFPLCPGGRTGKTDRPGGADGLAAEADGHGREHGHQFLPEHENGLPEAEGPAAAGPGLPDSGRGNAQPFRRRSPASEAGQRDRPDPDRFRVRVRRAVHWPAPAGCAGAAGGVPGPAGQWCDCGGHRA